MVSTTSMLATTVSPLRISEELGQIERVKCSIGNGVSIFIELGKLEDLFVGGVYCLSVWTKKNGISCYPYYFHESDKEHAVNEFMHRVKWAGAASKNEHAQKLSHINVRNKKRLVFGSHYDYLDLMLNPFWTQVFGKTADERCDGGMVTAHGDKCYSYKSTWARHDIDFQRGALLFLLSYTTELGDCPKYESEQWVINTYHHYLPKIMEAEAQVLEKVFNIYDHNLR